LLVFGRPRRIRPLQRQICGAWFLPASGLPSPWPCGPGPPVAASACSRPVCRRIRVGRRWIRSSDVSPATALPLQCRCLLRRCQLCQSCAGSCRRSVALLLDPVAVDLAPLERAAAPASVVADPASPVLAVAPALVTASPAPLMRVAAPCPSPSVGMLPSPIAPVLPSEKRHPPPSPGKDFPSGSSGNALSPLRWSSS
jgi:hypothetical protein